ncbi:hypothetical protein [Sulfuritalea sp.]|uniref:hypothetical protein n=1 Tax=Sulfuritalea sp. TaxID=2480090 RepID=UPI00286E07AA|nr:hypothetical protein [Sulfuritalea sp.]
MYRAAVITFVDILGFKALVSSCTYDEIRSKLETVLKFSGFDEEEDGEGFEPRIIQFSDSIIRIRPLDSKTNSEFPYGLAFFELLDLVHMQGELINHGICLRGGISIGDIHFEEKTIFGPGFVRAYELESIYAKYPRVVVDPKLIDALSTDNRLLSSHNSWDEEISSIRKNLRREDDGVYSIDYLRSFLGEIDEPEDQPFFLENHKKLILSNSKAFGELNPISAKYLWMAHYHNTVISELTDKFFDAYEMERSDLEISPKEMPVLQALDL